MLKLEEDVAKIIVSKLMDNEIDLEDEKEKVFKKSLLSAEEEIAKEMISDIKMLYGRRLPDGSIMFTAKNTP